MKKAREFLNKWLGWIVIVPTIYLIFAGESEMWLVLLICLLKMPPFDWVGRYEAWLSKKMKIEERSEKVSKWRSKQSRPVKIILTILGIILLILWAMYMPECELC